MLDPFGGLCVSLQIDQVTEGLDREMTDSSRKIFFRSLALVPWRKRTCREWGSGIPAELARVTKPAAYSPTGPLRLSARKLRVERAIASDD